MFLKVIFYLVLINQIFCAIDETDLKTSFGVIRGKPVNFFNKTINQYLGIPYAEPPIGTLRFSKPKPIEKSIEGIYDATVARNSCMQLPIPEMIGVTNNLVYNEDCLTLNIWSPKVTNVSALKPVMFWIFGGGLSVGSIYQLPGYNGTFLASYDVVLVTVNYRLGIFGFIYGGTDDSPGNLGLYDQLLALKWVRENIHLFGGDKNQITLYGESAGSWSISAHILSPLSRGLFQRAILESGAEFRSKNRGAVTKSEAVLQSKQLTKQFNCSDDNKWLDCLRAVDANKLVNYSKATFPLFETEFLPINAQKSFRQHSFSSNIDLIAGVTRNEGPILASAVYEQLRGNITLKQFIDLVNISSIFHDLTKQQVLDHYLKNVDTSDSNALRKAFYDYYGDVYMKCPTYLFAKEFSMSSPIRRTYFYEVSYLGKLPVKLGCDEKTMGICHMAEVEFVFGVPFQMSNYTKTDIDFSVQLMQMWINFAKTGDPGANWPQLLDNGQSLVKELNPHVLNGVIVDPYKVVCDELWKNYL